MLLPGVISELEAGLVQLQVPFAVQADPVRRARPLEAVPLVARADRDGPEVRMRVEARLAALGLSLPPAPAVPPGLSIPFAWVRVRGSRAFFSGHGPAEADGSPGRARGKVGEHIDPEVARAAARSACLNVLASLQRALGDLDRVTAWLVVHGMINAAPGFPGTTAVMNGFSDLVLELYGLDAGQHARTAIGVAALPLDLPVVVSGEVEVAPA